MEIKTAIPALVAAPWSAVLAIVAGFGVLWFCNRKPLIVPGIVDSSGRVYERKTHPVLRLSIIAVAAALALVVGFFLVWGVVHRAVPTSLATNNKHQQQNPSDAPPTPASAQPVKKHHKADVPVSKPSSSAPSAPLAQIMPPPVLQPAMPQNRPQPSPQSDPHFSAYQELGQAIDKLEEIDRLWGLSFEQQYMAYSHSVDHDPKAEERLKEGLIRLDATVMQKYVNGVEQQVSKARRDAIDRMRQPGKGQMTPNGSVQYFV